MSRLLKIKPLNLMPFFLLIGAHLAFFWQHYLGDTLFPWDFLGGYHSMAYAWLADGGMFSIPVYHPYTNFGFPSHLAIQNSSYYLPLELLHGVGIPYTYQVAVAFQCFHILVGSLGVFFLMRSEKVDFSVSLTASLLFQTSIGFFVNSQHVDIVRGYALTPWLLWGLSHSFLTSWQRVGMSALIVACFLLGSYPGIIVPAFYVCLAWGAIQLYELKAKNEKKVYLKHLVSLTFLVFSLVFIKYIPFLAQVTEIEPVRNNSPGFDFSNFIASFFRLDLSSISGHITMRSFYMAPASFLALFFLSRINRLGWFGLFLVLFSLSAVSQGPLRKVIIDFLPGFSLSRRLDADFRMFFHLGFIFLFVNSFEFLSQRFSRLEFLLRSIFLLLFVVFVTVSAFLIGNSFKELRQELFFILLSALMIIWLRWKDFQNQNIKNTVFIVLGIVSIGACWIYTKHFRVLWTLPDYKKTLSAAYGEAVEDLFAKRVRERNWSQRPRRQKEPKNIGQDNRSSYLQTFSQTGYDNGERLKKVIKVAAIRGNPVYQELHRFLERPGEVIFVKPQEKWDWKVLGALVSEQSPVQSQSFSIASSSFQVNTESEMVMIENELFYPGWRSEICSESSCWRGPEAQEIGAVLRGWRLPAGKYQLRTFYEPPFFKLGILLLGTSLFICLVLVSGGVGKRFLGKRGLGV